MTTLKEYIDKLNEIRDTKGNAFILCQCEADKEILCSIFSIVFSCDEPMPFVIRIGKGRYKDFIPKSEWTEDFIDYKIIILPTPKDDESWRYAGIFDKHYDWTAKQWQEHWGNDCQNPYIECFICEKDFEPEEPLYQCFVKTGLDTSKLRCICKKCAYKYSHKITDYKVSGREIKVSKWERGGPIWLSEEIE